MNPAFGPEGPSRLDLDAVCPDKPIILESSDHHTAWANTQAIRVCGITKETTVPDGDVIERDSDGFPSGTFRELTAMSLLDKARMKIGKSEYKEAFRKLQDFFAERGITTIYDALVHPNDGFLDAIFEMAENGKLKCRFRGAFATNESSPHSNIEDAKLYRQRALRYNNLIKLDYVKIIMDGVIEGKTGFLKRPYADDPSYCGQPIWDFDRLLKFCKVADDEDFNIHFHVIGDAACSMMLDCLDSLSTLSARKTRRPVATHLQLVDPEDISRLATNGVACVINPYWFKKTSGYYDGIEKPFLGIRAEHEYPMKSLFDAGLVIGAANDYPVTKNPYPLRGMQIAATRVDIGTNPNYMNDDKILAPDERVSLSQMIDAFTIGGSYSMGDEFITGTLEQDKLADLVVLDKNPFETPVSDLYDINVCMTMMDGKIVYSK